MAGQVVPAGEWRCCLYGHRASAAPIHPRSEFDDPSDVPEDETIKTKEIRPNFDLRKALVRLEHSELSEQLSILQAIHERFWHATIKDMERLLRKGGSAPGVIKLVAQVVRACKICREWARGLQKPTLRAEMAGFFNDIISIDLFFMWGKSWMLILDDCTRYKQCGEVDGKDGRTLLRALLYLWMRIFGPPRTLVSDQEGGIMSDLAGRELERFSIVRRPKGSERGKHTGTGGPERHVQLTKLSMLKIRAECDRQGLQVPEEDMAYEAAMAQNLVLEHGGPPWRSCHDTHVLSMHLKTKP